MGPELNSKIIGRKTAWDRRAATPASLRMRRERGSPAAPAPDEGQAKAVIAPLVRPLLRRIRTPRPGMTGRDDSSSAARKPAARPSRSRRSKGRRLILSARRWPPSKTGIMRRLSGFLPAIGRKDAADAIRDALAALDRKDYATAQGLFEALGQKSAAVTQVKRSAPASCGAPSTRGVGRPSDVVRLPE